MPLTVPYNGSTYTLPLPGENYGWGAGVTSYLQALSVTLAPNTSSFPLTTELDLGAAFGIRVAYLRSKSLNPAASGFIRMAHGDAIEFRNQANTGDLPLAVNASNQLTFNGTALAAAGAAVTSISVLGGSSKISSTGSPVTSSGTITIDVVEANLGLNNLGGVLGVAKGGTGNSTLTGYLHGNGASAFTATAGVPTTDLTGSIVLTSQVSGILPIANGGTGQSTAANAFTALLPAQTNGYFLKTNGTTASFVQPAKTDVGLANVDNTSDVNKPVSTAQAAAIAAAIKVTTKGDLFTYDTAPTRLPVGINGQALVADSTQATGLRWGAPSSTQLINATNGSNATVNQGGGTMILNCGSTLSTFTVFMPILAQDGQIVRIAASTGGVTSLGVSGASGQTVATSPVTIAAPTGVGYAFYAATSTWYRVY